MNNIDEAIKHHQLGDFAKAEKIYKKIIKKDNKNCDAWHLLGLIDYQKNRLPLAIEKINRAISINPNIASFYSNIGLAYMNYKDIDKAEESFKKALIINPNYSEAFNNLGNVLSLKGLIQDSIQHYKKAISLNPNYYEALYNLGNGFFVLENNEEALDYYKMAININPNYSNAYIGIAILLKKIKRYEESLLYFDKAFLLQGITNRYALSSYYEIKREICQWEEIDKLENRLINSALSNSSTSAIIEPFVVIAMLKTPDAYKQRLLIEKYVQLEVKAKIEKNDTKIEFRKKEKNERLKLAYISPNFYNQASMHLVSEMFKNHNKELFEVYIYAHHYEKNSSYYINAKKDVEHFIDVKDWDSKDIIKKIRKNEIDILIDLRSHGKRSRAEIVGSRVAPVQITFVNFAGTTGNKNVDYIVVDKTLVQEDELNAYSEKPIFMPNCYMPTNDSQKISTNIPSKKVLGLPENSFVFCNFNTLYKIEPEIFKVWMHILKEIDNSVLWLLNSNDIAVKNLKDEASKQGINPNRLIFANIIDKPKHLARMKQADLFLDTIYCNAHTSAIDCLYTEVPLITLYGTTYSSRVASSILKTVSLSELISENLSDYKSLALNIANNRENFVKIKNKLKVNKSQLFDTKHYVSDLESACLSILER